MDHIILETDSDNKLTPPEIVESAKTVVQLPPKSKEKYMITYNKFMQWKAEKKRKSMSEHTLLAYFKELSKSQKPSTMLAIYSMLKATIKINNDIDIYKYDTLIAFLKRQAKGYQSKKSNILTPEQIKKFLDEAPDNTYLATKLATIFGICGACRREELTKINIQDIEDKQSILLIKIPITKNNKPRSFVVTEEFYSIYKKYISLRPKNIQTSRFFLNYKKGKCTHQPIGINKFGRMPATIAKYLNLSDPDSYTGHTFRRTSATLLANSGADILTLKRHGGWKSNTVAEGYIEDSFNNKMKICNQITSTIAERSCDPVRRLLSASSFLSGRVVPFNLTDIGEGIRDVTVKEWYVKPGDRVNQFDDICEVQSDKASATITSRYDGIVKALHYKVDDVAMVGSALCDIEIEDDSMVGSALGDIEIEDSKYTTSYDAGVTVKIENQETDNSENKEREIGEVSQTESEDNMLGKVLATPAVRRIARETNIKLKDVIATGKGGRVLKEDILAHLQKNFPEVKEEVLSPNVTGRTVVLKGYSRHMWKTMTKSLSIPHFVYSDECNVDEVMRYRNEVKGSLMEQGVSLTLLPFFIKAASRALEQCPTLNAWIDEESQTLRVLDNHNIGIAMDTPEGLVVPNIKNVQNLSVYAIARELNRLQECGRKSSIPLADLTDTTFSLSNIGVVGGTYTKPVILPPQVIIGAFGKAQKLPRFDDKGNVVPASIMSVSWAADHRVVDGVTVAKFSNLWKHYVENPAHLLIGA